VRLAQEFCSKSGFSISIVSIKAGSKRDCDNALAVLVSAYGSHNGKVERKDDCHLSCGWAIPLRPWHTRYEAALGEDAINAMCKEYSLVRESQCALYGALKTMECCGQANTVEMTKALLSTISPLAGSELNIVNCALAIREAANKPPSLPLGQR